jgi:hypothetical protein
MMALVASVGFVPVAVAASADAEVQRPLKSERRKIMEPAILESTAFL